MDEDRQKETEGLFGRSLRIIASADPNNPTQRTGIAVALNRANIDTENITHHKIIPGRALLVMINWSKETKLTALAIYAPNHPSDNARFWENIKTAFANNHGLPRPKVMLGDFNMVEDTIDRFPIHEE